ncbi:hypothetical protein V6M85_07400 [Sulfolobus tengchongensis]|uniref:Uncharacterized protein n=1 Tax=Sulfolobus tengchongensis TaxID=207809 RepID=A0AAX4KXK3_9CREN
MRKPKILLNIIKSLIENDGHITSRELPRSKRTQIKQIHNAIILLEKLGVIKVDGDLDKNKFTISLVRDFQFLILEQKVKVIFHEDRSKTKSFKFHAIALKDTIREIEDNSYWSVDDKVKTRIEVYNPKREHGKIIVDRIELGSQKATIKLHLDPPSRMGERILHGFKVIQTNYFTFTQKETIERYGDPEMMDGLQVLQPTLLAVLEIKFPNNYEFIDVKAEKYDLVIVDGPQMPSTIPNHRLHIKKNGIYLKIVHPQIGYYFLAWKSAN